MRRNNIMRCRGLRKNQTDAEKKLWAILRARQLTGVKFRRQFSIGKYILDFYSPEYKLGIEADGEEIRGISFLLPSGEKVRMRGNIEET